MAHRRDSITGALFLAGLFAGAAFLVFGALPQTPGFSEAARPPRRGDEYAQIVARREEPAAPAAERQVDRAIVTSLPLGARLPDPEEALQTVEEAIAGVEPAVNQTLDRDHTFIQLYGGAQRLLGRQSVEDAEPKYTVVRLQNGMLTFAGGGEEDQTDIDVMAREMASFARRVENQCGATLLYIQAPSKLDISALPEGVTNGADARADRFLERLDRAGVDTLDLRPVFRQAAREDRSGAEALFFRTDHHWTPRGAFLGFQTLAAKLGDYRIGEDAIPIDPELLDEESYDIYLLEDRFLGSQGKRVGTLYGGVDDLEIWSPTFATDFSYTVNSEEPREGPFAISLLFPEKLTVGESLYDTNPYVVWSGGDFFLTRAVNRENSEGPRILVLRDSYGCAFTPFLSLLGSETMTMDPRLYGGDREDMLKSIRWLDPDLVIVLNTTSSLGVDKLYPYLPTCREHALAAAEAEKEK